MKKYLLILTDKEHKALKILAAEKGLSIKDLILQSVFNRELENNKEELVTFTKKILSHYNALPDEWDELNSILGKD
jgi:hypothetical protein